MKIWVLYIDSFLEDHLHIVSLDCGSIFEKKI